MTTYRLTVRNGKIDSKELESSPPAIFGMLYGDRSIGAIAKALDEGSWVSLRLRGHPLLHEAVSQAYYAGARCVLELAWADPRYRPLFESPDYLDHYGLTVIGRMAKRAPPEAYRASPSEVAQVWIGAYQAAEAKASAATGAAEAGEGAIWYLAHSLGTRCVVG